MLPYFLRAEHNERGKSEFHATGGPLEIRHELPGVGQNPQDHPFHTANSEIRDSETMYQADAPKQLAEWVLRRSGMLTSTVAEVCAFVRTRAGLPAADIQFHMGAAFHEQHGAVEHDAHCGTIAPTLVSPASPGTVTLRSADPGAKPRILTNALTEQADVDSMVAGIRLAREIAASSPLREKVLRELTPGPEVGDDDLEASLRKRVELLYHPVGTCRMGDGEDAVLDPELCVRGLQGLIRGRVPTAAVGV